MNPTDTNFPQVEITIKGKVEYSSNPDIADIEISISNIESTYGAALKGLDQKCEKLVLEVKKQKDDAKVITDVYRVTEKWSGRYSEDSKLIGYEATQKLSVSIPLEKEILGNLLDALSKANCASAIEISFLSSALFEKISAARADAIRASKSAAEDIARAADLRITGIKLIRYNNSGHPQSSHTSFRMESALNLGDLSAPDLTPANIEGSQELITVWLAIPS